VGRHFKALHAGTGITRAESPPNLREHGVPIAHHLTRRNAQNAIPEQPELALPPRVRALAPHVGRTVDFHDQTHRQRDEVRDAFADDVLPPEPHPELAVHEAAPEPPLRFRAARAHGRRASLQKGVSLGGVTDVKRCGHGCLRALWVGTGAAPLAQAA
jgi:hypothetical protein